MRLEKGVKGAENQVVCWNQQRMSEKKDAPWAVGTCTRTFFTPHGEMSANLRGFSALSVDFKNYLMLVAFSIFASVVP